MAEILHDPVSAENAEFSSYYLRAAKDVELKIMEWQPTSPESDAPVIFVAGWVSNVTGWTDLLRGLAPKQPVFYIETREKQSARVEINKPTPDDFSIKRISIDLINICENLPVDMGRAVLMGSSLGATALLEALKYNAMPARAAFLIGPNTEFKAPPVLKYLIHLHHSSYHMIKHIAIWYLRTFRVDAKKEPEQMKRYEETLRTAHARRLKLSAKAAIMMHYTIWPDIETVGIPAALAYAPSDKLHTAENIQKLAAALPRGSMVSCRSNIYMHSAEIIEDLHNFLNTI